MSKTQIDRDLRNEVIEFLYLVSSTSENLEARRSAHALATQMKPQRERKTKKEYTQNV